MRRLANRLTYANVTATLALVVALGGTSYAAFRLPRNSVGATQIRAAAVRSSEVKDRSLGVRDLSYAARSSLRGATGAPGPAGIPGPQGPAAAEYFTVFAASGARLAGNSTSGGHAHDIGTYSVGFARSVAGCAASATLGTTDATAVTPGRITVGVNGDGSLAVRTYDVNGTPTDLPFHVIVAC